MQSNLKLEKYNTADVYCLLAQVKEAQGDKKEALLNWNTCNKDANITIPEQDEWATMAQKRLNPQETRK